MNRRIARKAKSAGSRNGTTCSRSVRANAPVLVAQGLRVVAAVSDGPVRSAALVGSRAALAWWAYGEITEGANAVRRAIGVVALASVARSLTSRSRSQ